MAKFELQLPTDIIKDVEFLNDNSKQIFGEMTKAGAEVVYNNAKANVPAGLRKNASFMRCLKKTRIYETPSDDGINTKVMITGYFTAKHGNKMVELPAPLVANAFEYGTSERSTKAGYNRGKINKQPFFRKSFKKAQIESAMLNAQKQYSKGILK